MHTHTHTYIYTYRLIGLMGRVFANGLGDTKDFKDGT